MAENQINEAIAKCVECGAPDVNGMNCWEQLGAVLAWESHDRELWAEHFLTVASYNLQHPSQFTEEALANLRLVYIDYLDHGLPIAQVRKRVARISEGAKAVRKKESERTPVPGEWEMTIADVYIPDHSAGAADRVKAWAASVRKRL